MVGKQVIFDALMATMDAGDEVIVPAPYWGAYPLMTKVVGGEPVIVTCPQNNGFLPQAGGCGGGDHAADQVDHPELAEQPDGGGFDARGICVALGEVMAAASACLDHVGRHV